MHLGEHKQLIEADRLILHLTNSLVGIFPLGLEGLRIRLKEMFSKGYN